MDVVGVGADGVATWPPWSSANYRVKSAPTTGKPVMTAVRDLAAADGRRRPGPHAGEIIDFLASEFGPYPFEAIGRHRHRRRRGSASRWRTRPGRSTAASFFGRGDRHHRVVAHELAHQWYGDSVSVDRVAGHLAQRGLRHVRASGCGPSTAGGATAAAAVRPPLRRARRLLGRSRPARRGGREHVRRSRSTTAGAMTLHALRVTVGDDAFFRILQGLGQREAQRQRHHRRIHRGGRADLRAATRPALQATGCTAQSARPAPPPADARALHRDLADWLQERLNRG